MVVAPRSVALAEMLAARLKAVDLEIAREYPDLPDIARDLAACHFGLGVRMLVECGWSSDDIVALAEDLSRRVAEDLPPRN